MDATLAEQVRLIETERQNLLTRVSIAEQRNVDLEAIVQRQEDQINQLMSYAADLKSSAEWIGSEALRLMRVARRNAYDPVIGSVDKMAAETKPPLQFVPDNPPREESAGTRTVREILNSPINSLDSPMFLNRGEDRSHA